MNCNRIFWNKIIKLDQIDLATARHNINHEDWTAVIPAAGIGSRLGFNHPKVLFPILGKTILEHLLETVGSVCCRVVLVLSPAGAPLVQEKINQLNVQNVSVVLQREPVGMADAILQAEEKVETKNTLVVWGDQVTLKKDTLQACAYCHDSRSNSMLTLPTILLRDPYIHFERDEKQRLTRVFQAREENIPNKIGENDCGLFFFETKELFRLLKSASKRDNCGKKTGEFNLLPLLPDFDQLPGNVVTIRIEDESEALGINTREDAEKAEHILLNRKE